MRLLLFVWALLTLAPVALVSAENVTLKEYIDKQLVMRDRALDLAYEAMTIRLGSMNEFREQLREQSDTFASKVEAGVISDRVLSLDRRLDVLDQKVAEIQTKQWIVISLGGAFSSFFLIFIFREHMRSEEKRKDDL